MKFAAISDLHLMASSPTARIDNIRETQYNKLSYVLEWCAKNDTFLVQAGDFFDAPRSWYLLPEIIGLLKRVKVRIFCVFGQHDTYLYSEASRDFTSLGILYRAGLIDILDKVPMSYKGIQMYGASYGEPVSQVTIRSLFNVLAIHASIAVNPLWPGQEYTDAQKFMQDNPDFNCVLAGDIHRVFSGIEPDGRFIINTGPMIRKTAEMYSFTHEPNFAVIDTENLSKQQRVIIPHKPAEEVLSRRHIDKAERDETILVDFVDAIQEDYAAGVEFNDNLIKIISKYDVGQEVIDFLSELMGEAMQ